MLGRAVHSLSRIGDELYLEPLDDGVRGWDTWVGGWHSNRDPNLGLSLPCTGQDDRGQICLLSFTVHPPVLECQSGSCYLPRPVCELGAVTLPEVRGDRWG